MASADRPDRIPSLFRSVLLAACAAALMAATASAAAEIHVDADFPGGNIVVRSVESDTVFVAPDQRDIEKGQWWFYWSLRLRAPAGKPVTIVFTDKNPIGVRGPAASTDGGATWRWLGANVVQEGPRAGKPSWSFVALVPDGQSEMRYAFCPQYLERHLRAWLATQQDHPALRVEQLCRSRQGRSVEVLHAGCLERAKAKGVVLLTSRHHACETMATYAMEGFLSAVLADDALGQQWRANWETIAIPFMDKDGVEQGDQGKLRAPHDHNRDYNPQPLYPEVAAVMKLGSALQGRVLIALDLHCPWIRGQWNDRAYFVGPPDEGFWQKERDFAGVLERVQQGPLRFHARDCLPFGTAWNTLPSKAEGKSFSTWAREAFPEARLVASLELAYADALGLEVNAGSARAFGRDLARAMAAFLE